MSHIFYYIFAIYQPDTRARNHILFVEYATPRNCFSSFPELNLTALSDNCNKARSILCLYLSISTPLLVNGRSWWWQITYLGFFNTHLPIRIKFLRSINPDRNASVKTLRKKKISARNPELHLKTNMGDVVRNDHSP